MAFNQIVARMPGEPSSNVRVLVDAACALQIERYSGTAYYVNAAVEGAHVRRYCALDEQTTGLLRSASSNGSLSARVIDRIARVARTVADLAGAEHMSATHVAEAIGYRTLERRGIAT